MRCVHTPILRSVGDLSIDNASDSQRYTTAQPDTLTLLEFPSSVKLRLSWHLKAVVEACSTTLKGKG